MSARQNDSMGYTGRSQNSMSNMYRYNPARNNQTMHFFPQDNSSYQINQVSTGVSSKPGQAPNKSKRYAFVAEMEQNNNSVTDFNSGMQRSQAQLSFNQNFVNMDNTSNQRDIQRRPGDQPSFMPQSNIFVDTNISENERQRIKEEDEKTMKQNKTSFDILERSLYRDDHLIVSDEALSQLSKITTCYSNKEEEKEKILYQLRSSAKIPEIQLPPGVQNGIKFCDIFLPLDIIYSVNGNIFSFWNYMTGKQCTFNFLNEPIKFLHIATPKPNVIGRGTEYILFIVTDTHLLIYILMPQHDGSLKVSDSPTFQMQYEGKDVTYVTSTNMNRIFLFCKNNVINEVEYGYNTGWFARGHSFNIIPLVKKNFLFDNFIFKFLFKNYTYFGKAIADPTRHILYALNYHSNEEIGEYDLSLFNSSSVMAFDLGFDGTSFDQIAEISQADIMEQILVGSGNSSNEYMIQDNLIMDLIPLQRNESKNHQLVLVLRNGTKVFIKFQTAPYEEPMPHNKFRDLLNTNDYVKERLQPSFHFRTKCVNHLKAEVKMQGDPNKIKNSQMNFNAPQQNPSLSGDPFRNQRQNQNNFQMGMNSSINQSNPFLNRIDTVSLNLLNVFYVNKKTFVTYTKGNSQNTVYLDIIENDLSRVLKNESDIQCVKFLKDQSYELISREVCKFDIQGNLKGRNPIFFVSYLPKRTNNVYLSLNQLFKFQEKNGKLSPNIKYMDSLNHYSPNCMDEVFNQMFLDLEEYMICLPNTVHFINKLRPLDRLAKILIEYSDPNSNQRGQMNQSQGMFDSRNMLSQSNLNQSVIGPNISNISKTMGKFEEFVEDYGLIETTIMLIMIATERRLCFYFKGEESDDLNPFLKKQSVNDGNRDQIGNRPRRQFEAMGEQNIDFGSSSIYSSQVNPPLSNNPSYISGSVLSRADLQFSPYMNSNSIKKLNNNSEIINSAQSLLKDIFDFYSSETQCLYFLNSVMIKEGNSPGQTIKSILDNIERHGKAKGLLFKAMDRHKFFVDAFNIYLSRFIRLFWEEDVFFKFYSDFNQQYKIGMTPLLQGNQIMEFKSIFRNIQNLFLKIKTTISSKAQQVNQSLRQILNKIDNIKDIKPVVTELRRMFDNIQKGDLPGNYLRNICDVSNGVINQNPMGFMGINNPNMINRNNPSVNQQQIQNPRNIFVTDYNTLTEDMNNIQNTLALLIDLMNYISLIDENKKYFESRPVNEMNHDVMRIKFKDILKGNLPSLKALSEEIYETFLQTENMNLPSIKNKIKKVDESCYHLLTKEEREILKVITVFKYNNRNRNPYSDVNFFNSGCTLLLNNPDRINPQTFLNFFSSFNHPQMLFRLITKRLCFLYQNIPNDKISNLDMIPTNEEMKSVNPYDEYYMKNIRIIDEFKLLMTLTENFLKELYSLRMQKKLRNNNFYVPNNQNVKFFCQNLIKYLDNYQRQCDALVRGRPNNEEELFKIIFEEILSANNPYISNHFYNEFNSHRMIEEIQNINSTKIKQFIQSKFRQMTFPENDTERQFQRLYGTGAYDKAFEYLIDYVSDKTKTLDIKTRMDKITKVQIMMDKVIKDITSKNEFERTEEEKRQLNIITQMKEKQALIQASIYMQSQTVNDLKRMKTNNPPSDQAERDKLEADINDLSDNYKDLPELYTYSMNHKMPIRSFKIFFECFKYKVPPSASNVQFALDSLFKLNERNASRQKNYPTDPLSLFSIIFKSLISKTGYVSLFDVFYKNQGRNGLPDLIPIDFIINRIEALNYEHFFFGNSSYTYEELINRNEQYSIFWFVNFLIKDIHLPIVYVFDLYSKSHARGQLQGLSSYDLLRDICLAAMIYLWNAEIKEFFGEVDKGVITFKRQIIIDMQNINNKMLEVNQSIAQLDKDLSETERQDPNLKNCPLLLNKIKEFVNVIKTITFPKGELISNCERLKTVAWNQFNVLEDSGAFGGNQ
ncbi:MAG: hypothetical protein MJ252_06045 [archaeon]|nr:hypothetical protein [archaeon]